MRCARAAETGEFDKNGYRAASCKQMSLESTVNNDADPGRTRHKILVENRLRCEAVFEFYSDFCILFNASEKKRIRKF